MYRKMTGILVTCILLVACSGEEAAETSTAAPETGADTVIAQTASTGERVLRRGAQAPLIEAIDIRGQEVNLLDIIDQNPDLVITFFFSVDSGREVALKLRGLQFAYQDSLKVIALGLKDDEEALKQFASEARIDYYVIDSSTMEEVPWLTEVTSLPLTLFIEPNQERMIVRRLEGATKGDANLIKDVARNFFLKQKYAKAAAIIQDAKNAGEDAKAIGELSGYILTAEGKLDEAEAEFGAIDSKEGLAKVALEKGDYEKAIALAEEAGTGYADTVKGTALQRQGKLDEAAVIFEAAATKPAEEWQRSEAINAHGRILHEKGEHDKAIEKYRDAVELSPYNVIALSNEGAAQRETGNIEAATEVLEKAQRWGGAEDELIRITLKQLANEQSRANDTDRLELQRKLVKDLGERYRQLQEAGEAEPVDPWSSRPQILAFLPTESGRNAFFERAGTDIVIRREIEARLAADPRVRIVERELINELLAELNLGSSDLADSNNQLQLGKVLSVRMFGFIEFATAGQDNVLYARLAETETSELTHLTPRNLKSDGSIQETVDRIVAEILEKIVEGRRLQGLIATAESNDDVLINLGAAHGVSVGDEFNVVEEGEPIMAGGRVVRVPIVIVGKLEVTAVEEESGTCKVVRLNDGVTLAPEMKIQEPRD